MKEKNTCYTYFRITGNFDPDDITERLGLEPEDKWKIGEPRRHGIGHYTFAHWEIGRCKEYRVCVTEQMEETIRLLTDRVDLLNEIREQYNAEFTLMVVPNIFAGNGEKTPYVAPSHEVIAFCAATHTRLDFDMYFHSEEEERLDREQIARENEQRAKELAKKSVGEIIREARQRKGLKQDALAAELHVTPQAISKWENGQTAPDINLLLPLASALGLNVDQLLGGNRRQDFELRFTQAVPYGFAAQLLVCEDALKEFPNDEDFLYRRACCEFFLGKDPKMSANARRRYLNKACANLWRMHQKNPDNDSYIAMLAQVYVEQGEREQARILLSQCKNLELVDRLFANVVLEGDEKIKLQQMRVSKQITELYNRLLEYNTPDSIAAAHALLDITMGEEKHLHCGVLQMLYLAQATFALDAGDMAGYEKHMMEAYEAAEMYDREIENAGRFTAPLFDHLDNEYVEWAYSEMEALLFQVLTNRKFLPPCEAKRRMVEQNIDCRPLLQSDGQTYCRFCVEHVAGNADAFHFSNIWDLTEEELTQINENLSVGNQRYFNNGPAYHIELHRGETERLIKEGIMSGYVACNTGRDCPLIFGYCNCGAKGKYKGFPRIWKAVPDPKGSRVLAIMELLIPKNFENCGLEQKLLTYALDQAKEQGFTQAQTFLWEYDFPDGIEAFERAMALYTGMGFTLYADLSSEHGKTYVLQREL